uniref:Nitrile-specifier protein 5 n=1 Tax=Oryza barthii TaxID=65489 RepID=A0A0D3H439_9ORYZ
MAAGTWVKLEQKGDGPGARSSHAITLVGGTAYAFGGEFTPRVPVDNAMYAFDLKSQCWSALDASGDVVPPPRVGVTMASVGATVYVFGGCGDAGRLNDLWAYDVAAGRWEALPSPGEACKPRGGPGLAVAGGKVWVVYGFSGEELDDVHCYDPGTGAWSTVETTGGGGGGDKPSPRSVFCAAGIGKHVVVFGGEVDPSDLGHLGAGKFSAEAFALDTETGAWARLDDAGEHHPGPRGWCAFSAGEVDGRRGLLVYGGNSPTNDRLGDIYFFTPPLA